MKWTKITKDPTSWPNLKEKVLVTYLKDYGLPWGKERVFEITARDHLEHEGYPVFNSITVREDVAVHWTKLSFKEEE